MRHIGQEQTLRTVRFLGHQLGRHQHLLKFLLFGNILHDPDGTDDLFIRILQNIDREIHVDQPAIFVDQFGI